jgi:uncharacterized protein (TIGR03435 family)
LSASIRPGRRIGGSLPGARGSGPSPTGSVVSGPTCSIRPIPEVRQGQIEILGATVYGLVSLAYDKHCTLLDGGPDWAPTEPFDIQALLPAAVTNITPIQIQNGDATSLESMVQQLLAERFGLALHREVVEMSVYNLSLIRQGPNMQSVASLNPPELESLRRPDGTIPGACELLGHGPRMGPRLSAYATSMHRLAGVYSGAMGRPVIDRTNLTGLYNACVYYDAQWIAADPVAARIAAVEEQLGLRLELATAPVEILVIDSVERP